jgi:hypothetical protein
MRQVKLNVSGIPMGQSFTWAYPSGGSLGKFIIPTYRMTVSGTDGSGKVSSTDFEVFRFGVSCKDGKTATVVGLADAQTHRIKSWIPTYRVHSANSPEDGAWQVYDNFLIHDGPDNSTELYASIGCIEVMGAQGFIKLNDLIISLSGPKATTRAKQLVEIGKAGNITIQYQASKRPPLKKAP